jgi:hypothetical protein
MVVSVFVEPPPHAETSAIEFRSSIEGREDVQRDCSEVVSSTFRTQLSWGTAFTTAVIKGDDFTEPPTLVTETQVYQK